jgi:hypothetical protein
MVHWAQSIGPHTARLFERIMNDKPHPEMGYRSCLGIIRLAGQYSPTRMEAAAERALVTGACRYQSVKSILKNSLDAVPLVEPPPSPPPPPHDNIRGAEYFDWGETVMLKQPMIEKLLAMRLHGMAESLKTQEQDPAARELSFLERLGLLVDQQWNWRESQALGRRLKNAKLRTNACVEDTDYRGARGLDKSVIRALVQESAWAGMHENVFVLGPTEPATFCYTSLTLWKHCLLLIAPLSLRDANSIFDIPHRRPYSFWF